MVSLGSVLIYLGFILFLPGLFHLGMADEFGERTATNLRRMGFTRRAEAWNRERGKRLSLVATRIYWTLAIVCVIAGGILLLFESSAG